MTQQLLVTILNNQNSQNIRKSFFSSKPDCSTMRECGLEIQGFQKNARCLDTPMVLDFLLNTPYLISYNGVLLVFW